MGRRRRGGLILASAGGLLAGVTLQAQFGLCRVIIVAGLAVVAFGSYLLVHRYRYGRWTP